MKVMLAAGGPAGRGSSGPRRVPVAVGGRRVGAGSSVSIGLRWSPFALVMKCNFQKLLTSRGMRCCFLEPSPEEDLPPSLHYSPVVACGAVRGAGGGCPARSPSGLVSL